MLDTNIIDRLSRKYSMSQEEFVKLGSTLAMKEKKEVCRLRSLKYLHDMQQQP